MLDGPGADRGRGDRRLRAGRLAELHEPAERPQRGQRRDGGLAPERVEHEVEARAARRLAQRRGERRRRAAHRRVGAERARQLQPLGAARGRDDAARAEQPRGLDGDLADDAARAEHQHRLAGLQLAAPVQREPGGEPGDAEADGERRVEARGHGVAAAGGDQRALRERPVRLDGGVEVDGAAVGAPADALLARHVRRLVALVRERPGRDAHVDGVHAGGEHGERLGALGGRRIVEARRAPGRRRGRAGSRHASARILRSAVRWTTPRSPTTSAASCPA